MQYHYPDENVHLKFRLMKHKIGDVHDFKHNLIFDTKVDRPTSVDIDNLKLIYDTNKYELSNILGMDLTLHDIQIVIDSLAGSGIATSTNLLASKKKRLNDFYNSLINYIFELTHMLYYSYFEKDVIKQKSGKTFHQCLEIGIEIGMDIRRKYEAIFDKEFNASPAIMKYLESLKEASK